MKKRYSIPLIIIGVMVVLNVISRFSTSFSDFYVKYIFHYISSAVSFVTGVFPFSLGEMLTVAAVVLVIVGIPLFILLLIIRKGKRKKTAAFAGTLVLWILCYITTTETMNCFIMYHCTPLVKKCFPNAHEHTDEELTELYAGMIMKCNELSKQVHRDENGCFELTCDFKSEAKKAMKNAADKLSPQLRGYYPDPKPIEFSYFMSQSHLTGIYLPYTIEANYNDDMVRANLPSTVCHELAHLKGFIQEDEANFIAFVATTQSDNVEFQYSGYLDALEYVHNTVWDNEIEDAMPLSALISDEVLADWFRFMPENYWEENASKEIISTETVSEASTAAIDTNIKMNGRDEGIKAYSMVVNLLLDYYYP
ncbi:MAG: DUF3810 domain-containing protein [Ruminococcus sp.]|uniref:DUF3810 domain-containing protein n=1 Tax=Ruminococcus sp. TaxID=41978 RepID=UPI0025ECEFD0|nr:DUF3810 domain-containing protein [Ruminococcus sp.]MCR4796298.1 DUF3810 domain-containing protein [Ruminococcus sp.]